MSNKKANEAIEKEEPVCTETADTAKDGTAEEAPAKKEKGKCGKKCGTSDGKKNDERDFEICRKLLADATVENDTLREENEKMKKELGEQKDMYLRVLAEYENFRRRSAAEKTQAYSDSVSDTVTAFLPMVDNLERAAACKPENDSGAAILAGVEMVLKSFGETLEKLGVTEIPALGETFDPNLHNAVMKEDDPEKGENEITAVFQKGYRLGNKVIRYSMVKVAN